jgi:hypothetical protein
MRWAYIAIITPASIVIPLAVGIVRYRRLWPSCRPVLLYLLVAGLVNGMASVLAFNRIKKMTLLHVFVVLEFLLLAWFYRLILTGRTHAAAGWLCFFFPLLAAANALFLQDIHTNPTLTRSLEAFLISAFAVSWFFRSPPDDTTGRNEAESLFWINSGVFLYFAGAFFLFLFTRTLLHKPGEVLVWRIHATLVLLMYLLITIGFFKSKR